MGALVVWIPEALTERVTPDEHGCWIWHGNVTRSDGYSRVSIRLSNRQYKSVLTHRLAYELFVGPIPEGKDLHHTCENRSCCNPQHLVPMTHTDHMHGHVKSELFPCGHQRTPENNTPGRKHQHCHECYKQRMRQYYQDHKKPKPVIDLDSLFPRNLL